MIRRTIEISQRPARLSSRLHQLIIDLGGEANASVDPRLLRLSDPAESCAVDCEDIGLLVVEHPQTTYTHQALVSLLEHHAAIVICGRNHLPAGLLLPMQPHSEIAHRAAQQAAAPKPLCKQLWRQIIVAKVRAQAANLPETAPAKRLLVELSHRVRSGDSTNVEAQAARAYWPQIWQMLVPEAASSASGKHRDADGEDILNSLLNYGYAVLRAGVGRALAVAGLIPSLGIHHRNRSDPFPLADDLMEPLRPMVDARAGECLRQRPGLEVLDQRAKASLLELLADPVAIAGGVGPLMVALHRMAASLAECFATRGAAHLLIPVPAEPTEETQR